MLSSAFPLRGKRLGLELRDTRSVAGSVAVGVVAGSKHGVWVEAEAKDADGASAGELFLMEARDLEDPRRDAFIQGWVSALRRIIDQPSAPACTFAIGFLDQRMPLDVVSDASAAAYVAAFLQAKWLGRFLPERMRTPSGEAYEKAPKAAVTRKGRIDLDLLSLWIARHAELGYADPKLDLQKLDALPPVPRTLWYVFSMEGAVHNGGASSYLSQTSWFEIHRAYQALTEVGANKFADLIRRGVPVAVDEFPAFRNRDDRYRGEKTSRWRAGFRRDPKLSSTSELDGHEKNQSFFLIDHELRPRIQAYVERHQDVLIRESRTVST